MKQNKVRRSKLFYLRTAVGKKYRLKEKAKKVVVESPKETVTSEE